MSMANYFDVPNSETPIPLRKCASLQARKMYYQSEPYWVVKAPHNQEYQHLNEHQFSREITSTLTEFFKNSIVEPTTGNVAAGLHVHSREKRRKKLKQKLKNFLAIQWKGWDPEWFLERTFPMVSWFFSRPVVIANLALLLLTILWITAHYTEFYHRLPEIWSFVNPDNWASLGLAVVISKLFHELGHAYTLKKFGGECHEIGVMIFFFMPTLYCNTSDSWLLKNKWQRMWIGLGGIYVELVIFMIAALCWWFGSVGDFQNFCMNMMFVCSVSAVLTNGNALMRFDGYYVLADWLELPNLGQRSNKEIFRLFLHYGCGDRRKIDLWTSAHNKRSYVIYGVAAFLFRLFLIISISFFLVEYGQKVGLAFWALLIGAFSTGTIFFPMVKAIYKHLKEPGNWQQMKRRNLLFTSTLLAIIGVVVFLIPFPSWVPAECAVRVAGESKVFAQEGGKVTEILAKPGDYVERGDTIVRLVSPELEESLLQIELAIEQTSFELESKLKLPRELNDEGFAGLKRKQEMLLKQLDSLNTQLSSLEVVAPIDGVVVGVAMGPKRAETRDETLNKGFGNPLDDSNLHGTLRKGEPVCIVAPLNCDEISLVIEQKHVGHVKVGQPTKIMLSSYPGRLHSTRGNLKIRRPERKSATKTARPCRRR